MIQSPKLMKLVFRPMLAAATLAAALSATSCDPAENAALEAKVAELERQNAKMKRQAAEEELARIQEELAAAKAVAAECR